MAIATVNFQAVWTPENQHLQDKMPWDYPLIDVIHKIFTDFLVWLKLLVRWIARPLIGKVVLAAQGFSAEMNRGVEREWRDIWVEQRYQEAAHNVFKKLRTNFAPIPLNLTTPDNIQIKGVLYCAKQNGNASIRDIPTIIVCEANGTLSKQMGIGGWLLAHPDFSKTPPYNVAMFDYRGAGESQKEEPLFSDQLVLDADTVYQCMRQWLSALNIGFYGRSLGAAVATELRALHPDAGRCVNSHSFRKLTDLVSKTDYVRRQVRGINKSVDQRLPCALATPLNWLVEEERAVSVSQELLALCDWDFDVPSALQKIGQDVRVVYDPKDEMMQGADAYPCVPEVQRIESCSTWEGNRHMDNMDDRTQKRVLDFLTRQT